MGHPGTLPVLNFEAIKNVIRIGIAVDGRIADFTEWDRKNYFYPDIPKGYQISQYKYPLVSGGKLAGVELERIHLEEDTAQSTHDTHEKSLINFNRSGVPLMELVTKPVIHDEKTAVNFAKELQLVLRYLGAGEANMEKGEMRVEANISVASEADTHSGKFGTKTEVKNLNSFRAVEGAIAYEIERQSALLSSGGRVIQQTMGWDDNKRVTFAQRSKESSHDYRYFPDPDIPKIKLSETAELSISSLEKTLPELPWKKRERYMKDFGMTEKEVAVFVDAPKISSYFEEVIRGFVSDKKTVKLAVNYILTDYLGLLKKIFGNVDLEGSIGSIPAGDFNKLMLMVAKGDVSSRGAKDLLGILLETKGGDAMAIAEKNGLIQKSDPGVLKPAIEKVVSDNPTVVAEYKAGKTASLQYLIGQAMKATKGAGNPELVRKILIETM
jgi:aspartyl-tRNA(Asn)/glutamyl-tRNA(Gln) amidotransferase subunit B